LVGPPNRSRGALVVPVRAGRDDILLAKAGSGEAEVVAAEGTVRGHDVAKVARDAAVVAGTVAALAALEIAAEAAHAGLELLKDDDLGLDFADLLGDDPLGHLLEDEKALLDDGDGLGVANELRVLLDYLLGEGRTRKVAGAVEVVKAGHRGESTPVVERMRASTGSEGLRVIGKGSSDCGADDGSGGENLEDLGEHI